MGFWDEVGKLAKGALKESMEWSAEMQNLKNEMSSKSSDELHYIAKSRSSEKEKRMALYILKQRGEL